MAAGCQSEDGPPAHHAGHAERTIPLFPELPTPLAAAFDEAEPGTTHVITRYRNPSQNLRTHLHRIIRRAGLTPWEKPFQNCRSTRATELCEKFPLPIVSAWLGNSDPVAMKHDLQLRDTDFDRALQEGAETAQNLAQQPTAVDRYAN